jgi:hypothetical protein
MPGRRKDIPATRSVPADARKCQLALGAPAFQWMRTYLIFARDLPGCGAGVEGTHGSHLEITTVGGSGQIHFLAPFNVFDPLTSCLIFGVHSNFTPRLPAVAKCDIRFPSIDKAALPRSLRSRPHWRLRGYGDFERFPSDVEAMKTA